MAKNTKGVSFTIQGFWKIVWEALEWLVAVAEGIGILGGAMAAVLADVALGTVTFAALLSNTAAFNVSWGKWIPFLLSLGSTGIQIMVWQMVNTRGGLGAAWRASAAMKIALVSVLVLKIGDDFIDLTSVDILMAGNNIAAIVGVKWYTWLQYFAFGVVEVMAGFSEVFVVNAVRVMKSISGDSRSFESGVNLRDFHDTTRTRANA